MELKDCKKMTRRDESLQKVPGRLGDVEQPYSGFLFAELFLKGRLVDGTPLNK